MLDVAAGVRWLRCAGYSHVAVLGWSMGGSAVLRYAGLGGDADAVVSVSSPGAWFERGTRPMRLVHWLCETRTGRLTCRITRGTRLAATGWSPVPQSPAEVAGAIAPRPLLIVHGTADHYFPLHHAHQLAEAAPHAQLWIEAGMGHAETATSPACWPASAAGCDQSSRRRASATMACVSEPAASRARGRRRGAHAAADSEQEPELNLLLTAATALLVGAALVLSARHGALALLVAVAVTQALLAVTWAAAIGLPGRTGALLIAAAAAAGGDVAVSMWPHGRLGTELIVFGLAVPVMFCHQLARGAARVRIVESLAGLALLVAGVTALPAFVQLRHEFDPSVTGGHIAAGVLEAAAGALVVGCLVDMVLPAPRFDAGIGRGLLAVLASAGVGGSVGHLEISSGLQFSGNRGTFAGAAVGALVALFAVATTFIEFSTTPTEGRWDPGCGPWWRRYCRWPWSRRWPSCCCSRSVAEVRA